MPQIIILTTLFTLVFSWDQIPKVSAWFFGKFFPRFTFFRFHHQPTDHLVSSIVFIATSPIGLLLFFSSLEFNITTTMLVFLTLLGISFISYSISFVYRYNKIAEIYGNTQKIVPLAMSVMSIFYPKLEVISGMEKIPRKMIGKFTFLLSLPFAVSILVKMLNQEFTINNFLFHIDILNYVLVGGLIILITTEYLKRFFRMVRTGSIFTYFRILLGIVLLTMLML